MSDTWRQLAPTWEDDVDFILGQSRRIRFADLAGTGRGSATISLADETGQHSGSFKYRGAVLGVSRYPSGVVASGSGNFPAAVGLAAATLGIPATLVMPEDAPETKKRLALASGREVLFVPRAGFFEFAEREARSRGLPLLHPSRDVSMIVGSCSLGVELAWDIQSNGSRDDAVVVACGGGGLAAGTAMGLRLSGLQNDIYVAEPESHQRLRAAMEQASPVEIVPRGNTICDALRATRVSSPAFEVLQQAVIRTLTCSDGAVLQTQQRLFHETGIASEPSGALALAAVLENGLDRQYGRLWVVVCGGNQ